MNWKSLIVLLGLVATSTAPTYADSHKTEGRVTSELTFTSIDTDTKGYIHQGDLEAFRDAVFTGMDTDENGTVSFNEFRAWDPGFAYLAGKDNKQNAYQTALRVMFAIWDRDGDTEITTPEMRLAMNVDFTRADLNNDAILTEEEFLNGFTIIVALKAAFNSDL